MILNALWPWSLVASNWDPALHQTCHGPWRFGSHHVSIGPHAASVVADDVKLIPSCGTSAVGYENTIALHPIRAHQLGSWKPCDVLHTAIHGESEA